MLSSPFNVPQIRCALGFGQDSIVFQCCVLGDHLSSCSSEKVMSFLVEMMWALLAWKSRRGICRGSAVPSLRKTWLWVLSWVAGLIAEMEMRLTLFEDQVVDWYVRVSVNASVWLLDRCK
jgi:hypothetical protein